VSVKNLLRHLIYVVINLIVIALVIQLTITATRAAFEFGRTTIVEYVAYDEEEIEDEE